MQLKEFLDIWREKITFSKNGNEDLIAYSDSDEVIPLKDTYIVTECANTF